jgi:hypothetical protein
VIPAQLPCLLGAQACQQGQGDVRLQTGDHAVTPQAPLTGCGWCGHSYGGFGGRPPALAPHPAHAGCDAWSG